MLKELLKLDYSKLSLTDSITLEHRLYYDIYAEWVKIIERRKENETNNNVFINSIIFIRTT